jgi:SAM-dependent methyltransferase
MPASATATPAQIKDANTRYHDAAAADYDAKWGINFGSIGQDQVHAKVTKALGTWPERPFAAALEIGSGTGYLSLNMMQLGLIESLTATDISQGMLDALAATARGLDLNVETARCEAEDLPFDDESFDLVFGHAVLHHIPDLERAMSEFRRVLRPDGAVVFCGEPSSYGDRVATLPKRGATLIAPLWRGALRIPGQASLPQEHGNGHELEAEVDVHSFSPRELERLLCSAGFGEVRIRGEELLASLYGWALRTLESSADPGAVPAAWQRFAFRSYLALQRIDATLLEPRLPAGLFYNLVLSARKPN